MTTAPDDQPEETPSEEDPEEPGIGAHETGPGTAPGVVAPHPVADA